MWKRISRRLVWTAAAMTSVAALAVAVAAWRGRTETSVVGVRSPALFGYGTVTPKVLVLVTHRSTADDLAGDERTVGAVGGVVVRVRSDSPDNAAQLSSAFPMATRAWREERFSPTYTVT